MEVADAEVKVALVQQAGPVRREARPEVHFRQQGEHSQRWECVIRDAFPPAPDEALIPEGSYSLTIRVTLADGTILLFPGMLVIVERWRPDNIPPPPKR
jgi:hypothetical protein